MEVGLHQGSALNPLLFIIIMVLAEEARTKPPWAMLFADDLVLVSETLETELERRRAVIGNKGLIISRSKTGFSEVRRRTTVIIKQFQVHWFSNRWEWMVWKGCRWTNKSRLVKMEGLSGVIYNKKVPTKLNSKMYKTVVRPAMEYGSDCWALRKKNSVYIPPK